MSIGRKLGSSILASLAGALRRRSTARQSRRNDDPTPGRPAPTGHPRHRQARPPARPPGRVRDNLRSAAKPADRVRTARVQAAAAGPPGAVPGGPAHASPAAPRDDRPNKPDDHDGQHRHRRLASALIALLVLVVGGAVAAWLMLSAQPPAQGEQQVAGALVETITVQSRPQRLDLETQGTVLPARRVTVQPEVGGRLVWVNPDLKPGGVIEAGERLFQVDTRDYELAVSEARTAVQQAQAQLNLERGRQQVAEQEWEMFKDELAGLPQNKALATRQPQLAQARANLAAARDRLRQAQLSLERTSISAPFDALIEEESAQLGQLVSPQTTVARLVGTDTFWLQVALPVDRLPFIDVPGLNAEQGSPVEIRHEIGDRAIVREGRVARLYGNLNPEGRMARLLVEIPQPLRAGTAENDQAGELPLLIDAYVTAIIRGDTVQGLVELPRRALREGNRVYVAGDDGELDIREVKIAWQQPRSVLVSEGLEGGERVVVSPLSPAYDGMALQLEGEQQEQVAEAEQAGGG